MQSVLHFKPVAALSLLLAFTLPAFAGQPVEAKVSVCFTPAGQCEAKIVEAIDRARSSIRVQAYGFISLPIIHALQQAAGRGVEVLAILDKTNERKYSGATLLEAAGIPVWIDFEPAIAHNTRDGERRGDHGSLHHRAKRIMR